MFHKHEVYQFLKLQKDEMEKRSQNAWMLKDCQMKKGAKKRLFQ